MKNGYSDLSVQVKRARRRGVEPTNRLTSEPLEEAAASSAASTLVVAADELDEGAFLRRFLAFRQYVEMLQYLPAVIATGGP